MLSEYGTPVLIWLHRKAGEFYTFLDSWVDLLNVGG